MTPERWEQVERLFHAALEREPARRAAFLSRACAGDAEMLREVESLVASHERSGDFIEAPAADVAAGLLAEEDEGLAPGQACGPYRVEGLLGAGGMGKVYLAEDTRLGRRVALKLLPQRFTADADRVRRFEREARAASALNHPNILTVYEIGRDGPAHFIAAEFIDGETLRERMAAARVELAEALDVAAQVASALAAAHEVGVVHRDVKPENIMLRRDRFVKVLDFGLAKLAPPKSNGDEAGGPAPPSVKTGTGVLMGTARYMSPEQARGLETDARTDIWSLGVVLYEMLAARAPFEGDTNSDVLAAVLREEPAPLGRLAPEAPAELEWIVKKALAKDREERYQTARELQIDLKRLRQELELRSKLDGMAPARLRSGATGAPGEPLDELTTAESRAIPTAETRVGAGTRAPRRVALGLAALVVVAAAAASSLVSYRAGRASAPPPAFPASRQLSFRLGTISGARFAPDGNTLVYSAAFDGKPLELYTSRLERPESRSLKSQVGGRSAGIQSISSTGEMAILLDCELMWGECHDGTLARMPLVGGAPREIMEDVYAADWSPDGKELAVVRAAEGQYQLEYPIGKVLYKAPGKIDSLRVSPKGDMVVFVDHPLLDSSEGASIQVVDLAGNRKTLYVEESEAAGRGLAWSPAGDEVWFSAAREHNLALYAVTLSGRARLVFNAPGHLLLFDISRDGRVLVARGNPRTRMVGFTAGSGEERELSWFKYSVSADLSADGKQVLFHDGAQAAEQGPQVYLRKTDGSNDPVRLGDGKALALSPDGKWALALQPGPPPQLVLLPTGPGEPRLLPRGDIKEYHYASWFPGGGRILFTGLTEVGRPLRSYTQDIGGGQPSPVTEEGVVALSVSPDGGRLLCWTRGRGPDGEYYLLPLDGGAPAPLPDLGFGGVPVRWSADGRALYVREDSELESTIYRLDLRGGGETLVKRIAPDPVGMVGLEVNRPGGVQIAPDGKSYVYTYWILLQELYVMEGLK